MNGDADAIRIVVADDHPLFRAGLVASLRATDDILVVGEATNADEAVRLVREHLPDLALLDITMPGGGLAAARDIAATCPVTRIVVLTASEDEDDLMAALKAGSVGYVLKGVSAQELETALRQVHAGAVYVAPALAGRIMVEMTKPRTTSPLDELSARERDVLEMVAMGLSNAEIGQRLHLAEKTVKHYMTNILTKLQVRSRVEAALLAHKAGLQGDERRT